MRFLWAMMVSLTVAACTEKKGGDTPSTKTDTVQFFHLGGYIKEQIANVQQTPYFIYKRTIEKGKVDSFPITSQQFAQLASPFVESDINDPVLREQYTESPFFDQTTKTYTLNYTAKNKSLTVQNIDVLLQEDAKTLKRIFIRRFYDYKDSTAMEQLSWKPNQQFEISRMVQQPGGVETMRQETVVWNEKRNP